MKIPLIGVPRHLWNMITGLFTASPGLILWRLFLVIGVPLGFGTLLAAAGPGGVMAMTISFVLTTVLAAYYRADIVRIGANMWNAEWGEVRI